MSEPCNCGAEDCPRCFPRQRVRRKADGECQYCHEWEERGDGVGYCPLFDKLTQYDHGGQCTAWEPLLTPWDREPDDTDDRDPEPEYTSRREANEAADRAAMRWHDMRERQAERRGM